MTQNSSQTGGNAPGAPPATATGDGDKNVAATGAKGKKDLTPTLVRFLQPHQIDGRDYLPAREERNKHGNVKQYAADTATIDAHSAAQLAALGVVEIITGGNA